MANGLVVIYEVEVRLEGFAFPLVAHIEQPEYDKFIAALGNGGKRNSDFYGFFSGNGLKSYVNLHAVLAIHVPNYIAISAQEDTTEAAAALDGETANASVLLRVWSSIQREPQLYGDIPRREWLEIQRALDGDLDPFIGWTEETGERLMLPRRCLLAVEACESSIHGDAPDFRDFYRERARENTPFEVAIG